MKLGLGKCCLEFTGLLPPTIAVFTCNGMKDATSFAKIDRWGSNYAAKRYLRNTSAKRIGRNGIIRSGLHDSFSAQSQ